MVGALGSLYLFWWHGSATAAVVPETPVLVFIFVRCENAGLSIGLATVDIRTSISILILPAPDFVFHQYISLLLVLIFVFLHSIFCPPSSSSVSVYSAPSSSSSCVLSKFDLAHFHEGYR